MLELVYTVAVFTVLILITEWEQEPATIVATADPWVDLDGRCCELTCECDPQPRPQLLLAPAKEVRPSAPSIRQLKKLASEACIRGYSNMTKAQLMEALGL